METICRLCFLNVSLALLYRYFQKVLNCLNWHLYWKRPTTGVTVLDPNWIWCNWKRKCGESWGIREIGWFAIKTRAKNIAQYPIGKWTILFYGVIELPSVDLITGDSIIKSHSVQLIRLNLLLYSIDFLSISKVNQ